MAEDLIVTHDQALLRVTLNRPDKGNALTPGQVARLVALFDEAGASADTRAILLNGAGSGFCSGTDPHTARQPSIGPHDRPDRPVGFIAWLVRTGIQRLIMAVRECEKPVLAAVHGLAANAGLYLALSCDLVVAADDARFRMDFVQKGFVPDGGGIYLLPRIVGLQRAKEFMLLGEELTAADALSSGLVNRVVPIHDLETTAAAIAGRLATGPTKAIAFTKLLLNRSLDSDVSAALHDEASAEEMIMWTLDAGEWQRSESEGRPPFFRGW